MPVNPIVTLAIDHSLPHAPVVEPSPGMIWAMKLFEALGIPFTTVDGQLLPGSVILFILAVWGAWHLIQMTIGAIRALPDLHKKMLKIVEEYDERED